MEAIGCRSHGVERRESSHSWFSVYSDVLAEQGRFGVSFGSAQDRIRYTDPIIFSAHNVAFALAFILMSFCGVAMAAPLKSSNSDVTNTDNRLPVPAPKVTDSSCPAPQSSSGLSQANEPITASFKTQIRDRSCLVSVSAAEKRHLKEDIRFVDVRTQAEFEQYRISESINIPLHLVKTKNFLKNSPIVLVNDGRSTVELEKVCQELRQNGFRQVTVLEGGLNAWRESKRTLAGDSFAQMRINRMSPAELSVERLYADWLVLDASTPGKFKDLRQWLPSNVVAISIKPGVEPAAGMRALIARHRKTDPQARVLLVADDNAAYERLDARLQKGGTITTLRLDGGLTGYRDFLSRQTAMWNQQNKPKKLPSCRG